MMTAPQIVEYLEESYQSMMKQAKECDGNWMNPELAGDQAICFTLVKVLEIDLGDFQRKTGSTKWTDVIKTLKEMYPA